MKKEQNFAADQVESLTSEQEIDQTVKKGLGTKFKLQSCSKDIEHFK